MFFYLNIPPERFLIVTAYSIQTSRGNRWTEPGRPTCPPRRAILRDNGLKITRIMLRFSSHATSRKIFFRIICIAILLVSAVFYQYFSGEMRTNFCQSPSKPPKITCNFTWMGVSLLEDVVPWETLTLFIHLFHANEMFQMKLHRFGYWTVNKHIYSISQLFGKLTNKVYS